MARLGEAYVRIRADLEPFGRDLDRGLRTITDRFERSLSREFGNNLGRRVGSGIREGLRESTRGMRDEIDENLPTPDRSRRRGRRSGEGFGDGYGDGLFGTIRRISGLFITALEDGFSSLPPQVKGVVGTALVSAIIPAGGLLTSALGAAIIAGLAGIGIALASQYTEVTEGFQTFVERLRLRAVRAAEPFAGETLAALDLFDTKLGELDPKVRSLFANASRYVEPFARGIANAVDGLVTGLDEGLAASEFDALSASIENGLSSLGVSLGDALGTILANPDLDQSLSDLLETIGDAVEVGGAFLDWTVTAWAWLRRVGSAIGDVAGLFGDLAMVISGLAQGNDADGFKELSDAWDDLVFRVTGGGDKVEMKVRGITEAERAWNNTTSTTIKLTEAQEKAAKELNAAYTAQERLINDIIGTQIDYQAAIDQTTADLKENGRTLDLRNEKGRENAENVQREINALRDQVKAQVESGKLTDAQAEVFYQKEIKRIRDRFKGNKTLLAQFDTLYAQLINLGATPPVPNKLGPLAAAVGPLLAALGKLQQKLFELRMSSLPSSKNTTGVGPGQQKYADGGFVTEPTNAIMGENYRPELVLPLTNTRRSMQLLSQSKLSGVLGGATNVAVYIGNEQLDSRMVKVSSATNRQAARVLSQAPRLV